MNSHVGLVPFFKRGDIGGLTYLVTNNIVNYLIVIATLSGVLKWPDKVVFGYVIPGMSIGLFLGCCYYAWMGYRISKRDQRPDVTALPSGVSTTAMFVMLYGVIMPLSYAVEDPMVAWSAAMAACFLGGVIEFVGGIVGPWMKKRIPRAALLGTVAGIGFIWMATEGVFDIFQDPILGLPVMIIAMLGVFGVYAFPKKIPPLVVAIVGGIVYAFCLGRTQVDFSDIGFYIPNPVNSIQYMIDGFAVIAPYLAVIIPVEIYNFIETMDNVEGANAAGDEYSVRQAQFADGVFTMISACFGGVVPNTVWLGHVSLKRTGAGVGYSVIAGVILLLAGVLGLFTVLSDIIPKAVVAITFLWCAVDMLSQAFRVVDKKYYAAIGVAMVPSVADFLYTQVTGAAGLADLWTEKVASGINDFAPEVCQALTDAGCMWNGVAAVKAGAIVIGILLGTMVAFIIDRRLDKVAIVAFIGAVLSFIGIIHSAAITINFTNQWGIGYLITGVVCLILHFGRNSWCKPDEDMLEYVDDQSEKE